MGRFKIGDTVYWNGVNRTEMGIVTEIDGDCAMMRLRNGKYVKVFLENLMLYVTH